MLRGRPIRPGSAQSSQAPPDPRDPGAADLWVFFLIAFGAPWVCWTLLALDMVEGASMLGQALYLSGAACSLGGLVAVGVRGGKPALRRMAGQCVRFRVGVGWWLFAVLFAPAWHLVALAIHAWMYGGPFTFDAGGLSAVFSIAALYLLIPGPIAEELGWRGFLLPRLVERHGAVRAALIVGAVWTVWHIPLFHDQILSTPTWSAFYVLFVMSMSVIIGAVYLYTESILLAVIMHWLINATQIYNNEIFPNSPFGEVSYNTIRIIVLIGVALVMTAFLFLHDARRRNSIPPSQRA